MSGSAGGGARQDGSKVTCPLERLARNELKQQEASRTRALKSKHDECWRCREDRWRRPTGVHSRSRQAHTRRRDVRGGSTWVPGSVLTCHLPTQGAHVLVLLAVTAYHHAAKNAPAVVVPYTLPPPPTSTPSRFASRHHPRPSRDPFPEALPWRRRRAIVLQCTARRPPCRRQMATRPCPLRA